ncbi:glycosyltransferase family 4 protein [Hymenobacter sp. BT559]|uniref:glycosyltransferase family 4 protein n=1 Tax=Hymenobacter sp. BT559 TaxID=2795729 RepID=UPI0018EA7CA9|nr:glycosyltransferase family 4 protein [Hymenobacter sp. BT559]MBJ6143771.1 glycosyltransferase family 4 protein [Hymenobacter sp. BT559]
MYIGVVAPIATNDLLPLAERHAGPYPKGREGAPLISNLIKEYLRRGHRVVAITLDDKMGDDDPPFVHESPQLTYVVVPARSRTFRPNGRRLGRTADFFWYERRRMLAQLQHYRPEVVHAHWTYEFALAGLAYDPQTIVTVHDNALVIYRYVRTLNRLFHLLMARYVFRKGHWFTAVSPYMADSVQPWTKAKVAVIANPVVIPERASLVKAPLSQPVISVVVNGWDDRKNSKNALLAFKAVQQQHPAAVLWAMGTAFVPDEDAAAFCQEHAIKNVVFLGPTPHDEVLKKIAASTLVLHTSLEESFGMVLVEAMAYGVPVVAGQASGAVPWVVADGGLLVDVTSVAAIADAVNRLLSDPALYAKLSARAVAIVAERFPLATVADQYLGLYEQCLAKK